MAAITVEGLETPQVWWRFRSAAMRAAPAYRQLLAKLNYNESKRARRISIKARSEKIEPMISVERI